ncbi:MAG: rod shape-determining protein MreD [bacterium]|nr:MAG: rod shape-determining protein MreD [bacterium]
MRLVYFLILGGAALFAQSTVIPFLLPYWLVSGMDLPLIVVVHVALTRGKVHGMMAGAALGYLQDAMSGGVIGINGLAKIVGGFSGGYLREKFFVSSIAHRAGSVAGAVLFSVLSKVVVLSLFAQPRPGLLSPLLLWTFMGNALLALASHSLLVRLEGRAGIRREEELSLGD